MTPAVFRILIADKISADGLLPLQQDSRMGDHTVDELSILLGELENVLAP